MFGSFLKKELLQFSRRPQELLILLFMPFVLITILGFALGGIMDGDAPPVQITVAIVEHTSEENEIAEFEKTLLKQQIPEEEIDRIVEQLKKVLPITLLKDQLFENPDMQSFVSLVQIKPSEMEKVKKEGEYAAIIEVPEHFTSKMLESMFLGSNEKPDLILYMNEGKELSADIIKEIVEVYQTQYSTFALFGRQQVLTDLGLLDMKPVIATVRTIDKNEPVSAMEYYSVGMSVMFILFTASSVGALAYFEKMNHLFDRILLSNISSWAYMASIFITTVILSFIQLSILFIGTALFYGVRFPDVSAFLIVTVVLCTAVGGIATLLTSINYRLNSSTATSLFQSAFIAVLSFFGGSYFQMESLSEWFGRIGGLTPNGAAMKAYLKLLQGDALSEVSQHLFVLLITSIVLISIAVILFPKKGGTA